MAEYDQDPGAPAILTGLRRVAHRAGRLVRRYPFTLATLVMVIVVGIATHSVIGRLSPEATGAWGFAPRDLMRGRLARLVISAVVTPGGRTFWEAILAVIVLVGASERMAGTARAVLAFWGVHLIALIALSPLGYLAVELVPSLGTDPIALRTVGPSAGYVGSLGLVVSRLPVPWRRRALAAILAILVVLIVLPVGAGPERVVWLTDGLAHLMAFALGLGVGWWRAPQAAEGLGYGPDTTGGAPDD